MRAVDFSKGLRPVVCLAVVAAGLTALADERVIDLAGTWQFALDRGDVGESQRWFDRALDGRIALPGSLQAQGLGDDVTVDTAWTGDIVDRSWFTDLKYARDRQPGRVRVPFWLQPKKHYVGAAWYRREVAVPESWRGKRITLSLERAHWTTALWVDGKACGMADSLSTAHQYDLSGLLPPGTHQLAVRVDNRLHVGVGANAHSVTDHTQSNWNGIVGRLELRADDPVGIDLVQVYPDCARRAARVRVTVYNRTGRAAAGTLTLSARWESAVPGRAAAVEQPIAVPAEGTTLDLDLPLGTDAPLWDEFAPNLIALTARVRGEGFSHARVTAFGLREFTALGTQLAVNGRKVFLRGTLECCIFPLTGYPPTDVASWTHILERARAHGLNHVRFHSWCPPEAAFVAADRMGFYYQIECAAWVNQGSTIGDGLPIDAYIPAEAERILRAYGNHPSFCMLAYGNEPAGKNQNRYLGSLVDSWKASDPRRVVTGAAGWPILPENQYHCTPAPRIQAWGAGLKSRINAYPPETCTDYRLFVAEHAVPVVSHEIGQWCAYPNFDEIPKYRGVLQAKNFELFRDLLAEHGLADRAHDFLMASGKLQVLCYKEEIESALRTPGFGGFQLLDLHDFPGQGTALVGVLDPFWDSKPYIGPEEFRRFCGPTVPLARLPRRVWTAGETLQASIDVAHFGPADLADAVLAWRLEAGGQAVASGKLPARTLSTGALTSVGEIRADLHAVAVPARMRLIVSIEGTSLENDWDLWCYPSEVPAAAPADVAVTARLDEAALARLAAGGKVLWLIPPAEVRSSAVLGFSSIFWNTAWTRNQPPHTLGILCDPKGAAFAAFPTEYHTNWQWWYLVSQAAAMQLDGLPPSLRPTVEVIDTWFENRRLGLVFEARAGGGKLAVCSIDLAGDLKDNPVARQFRHSLLAYLGSERFDPKQEVTIEALESLVQPLPAVQQ